MRVLVTGSAGFVGSRIFGRLKEMGHDVVGVDPVISSTTTRKGLASAECGGESFDAVWHLAAQADVASNERDPIGAWKANVLETLHIVERVGVKKALVFANSVASEFPNANVYGWTKSECLRLLRYYRTGDGRPLPLVNMELPNLYGVGGDGVVSRFLFQREPVIFGDGGQEREFAYIDDVVEHLVAIGLQAKVGDHMIGGDRRTINDIAKAVKRDIPHGPPRAYELRISPVLKATFRGATTLDEGIAKMVEVATETGLTHYYGGRPSI